VYSKKIAIGKLAIKILKNIYREKFWFKLNSDKNRDTETSQTFLFKKKKTKNKQIEI